MKQIAVATNGRNSVQYAGLVSAKAPLLGVLSSTLSPQVYPGGVPGLSSKNKACESLDVVMVLRKCANISAGLVLAVASSIGTAVSEPSAETSVVEPFRMLDWAGFNQVSTLSDGTSLYRYVAQSSESSNGVEQADSQAGALVNFRISFLPRFQCTPLVSVFAKLPENLSARDRVELVRNFNEIELTVDDEPVRYPALVEFEDEEIHSYFDAALGRRMTLRILIELGSRLQIKFGNGSLETLSLLGSRRVLETAVGRCKKHS